MSESSAASHYCCSKSINAVWKCNELFLMINLSVIDFATSNFNDSDQLSMYFVCCRLAKFMSAWK
jgi:hypothetical protein